MELTRRAALRGLLATSVGAFTGAVVYGGAYERHRITLSDVDLSVSGLPTALDGLRIAFITDIHHSALVPAEDVSHAVALASMARPDLIVLGGDYVTYGDRTFVGPVSELLGPLQAPSGVFAILGNHDDDRDMAVALMERGFTVLRDQRTRVAIRGENLDVAGIRFWTRRPADIARVLRGAGETVLLLAHDPRRFEEAAAFGVGAVLAGHTHGGQIVLPGLGALAARKFPIAAGTVRRDNTSMFVSRGIGTVYVPLRINCPPEVALVTLRRKSNI